MDFFPALAASDTWSNCSTASSRPCCFNSLNFSRPSIAILPILERICARVPSEISFDRSRILIPFSWIAAPAAASSQRQAGHRSSTRSVAWLKKVKMRCSRSGSPCEVLTCDTQFPFDIITFLTGCLHAQLGIEHVLQVK